MNTKRLSNPQMLGAPLARKRRAFSEKLLAKTIARAYEFGMVTSMNYNLLITLMCPISCCALLGMLILLAAPFSPEPSLQVFQR